MNRVKVINHHREQNEKEQQSSNKDNSNGNDDQTELNKSVEMNEKCALPFKTVISNFGWTKISLELPLIASNLFQDPKVTTQSDTCIKLQSAKATSQPKNEKMREI